MHLCVVKRKIESSSGNIIAKTKRQRNCCLFYRLFL
ncbi:Uncharacterised protein [Vibrio cholerae]|nr:Uncharacterised protein [Vibrio cholerae]